jgi:hypothetical protein
VIQSARACEKKRRSENEVGSLEEGKRVHGILVCLSVSRSVCLSPSKSLLLCCQLQEFGTVFYIT